MVATNARSGAEMMPQPDIRADEIPVEGVPIFREREKLLDYLGVEKEAVGGREELLQRIREQSPEVNGNVEKALEQVKLNREQIEKKESFLRKVLMFPIRHPVITTAAVAALLYFTGAGAFLAGRLESVIGALPDGKIRAVLRGLKGLGGATGTLPPGVNPYSGIEGTPL